MIYHRSLRVAHFWTHDGCDDPIQVYSGDAAQEELQKIMDYKDRSLWIHKKLRYGQLKV